MVMAGNLLLVLIIGKLKQKDKYHILLLGIT